jgi:hypothetical protein
MEHAAVDASIDSIPARHAVSHKVLVFKRVSASCGPRLEGTWPFRRRELLSERLRDQDPVIIHYNGAHTAELLREIS